MRFSIFFRAVTFVIMSLLTSSSVYSYHLLDVLGGTGALTTNVMQQDYASGSGKIKAETVDRVVMRETTLIGLRYSHYSPTSFGFFYLGGEVHGMFARPSVGGDWRFSQYDSKDKLTGESFQSLTSTSAPGFNSLRSIFHLGVNFPTGQWLAIELGVLVGVGGSEAKYVIQSPYSQSLANGYSAGFSGIGVQGAFRFGLQLFLQGSIALCLEYRLIADGFGGLLSIIPGLQSNTTLVGSTGHLFLASVGYRFGFSEASPVSPQPEIK